MQVDELVPVARGGSPYDPTNCKAAHACCNQWRKTKTVAQVERVKALVTAFFGGSANPLDFVSKAKLVTRCNASPPRVTTDW